MAKSLKEEIEEFWGSLFSDVLKEYLDTEEANIVEPIQDFPEHQRPDVLYEISYKSNKKDRTWAEITLVYPHNDAAKHVHQAAISGQRDTPEQQEALDAIVKSALRASSDMKGEVDSILATQPTQFGMFRSLSGSFDMKEEPLLNSDPQIADNCNQSILKKMQKSYGHLCEKYGRGHLLVVIPHQTYGLVNRHTVQYVESVLTHTLYNQQCNFRSLWIVHRQPEVDNLIIYHDPSAASPRYAFYCLWPEHKIYIVEIANDATA